MLMKMTSKKCTFERHISQLAGRTRFVSLGLRRHPSSSECLNKHTRKNNRAVFHFLPEFLLELAALWIFSFGERAETNDWRYRSVASLDLKLMWVSRWMGFSGLDGVLSAQISASFPHAFSSNLREPVWGWHHQKQFPRQVPPQDIRADKCR